MFSVFGDLLDPINNKASHEEIIKWKRSDKTVSCFKLLFVKISNNSEETYMSQILNKIWPSGETTNEKVAYAIAVCQTILDPKQENLTISESVIKNKLAKNLVSFVIRNLFNIITYKFRIIRLKLIKLSHMLIYLNIFELFRKY
jgi:hypothetical protein